MASTLFPNPKFPNVVLTFYHICLVICSLSVFFFTYRFFLNLWESIADMMPHYSLILHCTCPKNKDILLHDHRTVIKIRKWTLIQYSHLVLRAHVDFSGRPNHVLFCPRIKPRITCCIICHDSFVPFNWEQFQAVLLNWLTGRKKKSPNL